MKSKKILIWLCSIVGCLCLIITLCFTLFKVRNVSFNFKNETTLFQSDLKQKEMIESAEINYSIPVFAVNKKQIIKNLESKNHYLKVINIETRFPNKLVLHCIEREEMYCIKSDEMYFICDSEFKILSKTKTVSTQQGHAINLTGTKIVDSSLQAGEFLSFLNGEQELLGLINQFLANNRQASDVKAMFKQIDFYYDINYYTKKTCPNFRFVTYDDFEINLRGADSYLTSKVNLMLALIPKCDAYYNTHSLIIDINPNDTTDVFTELEDKVSD